MQAPLDIRYAGVNIGRALEIRNAEGESTYFLPGKEPMPVGTVLRLRSHKGETPARVVRAIESSDPAVCGMQVRLIGEEEEVAPDWIPAPAPAKPKAPVVMPAPLQELPPPSPTTAVVSAQPEAEAAAVAAVPEAVPVAVASSLSGVLAKAADEPVAEAAPAAPAAGETAQNTADTAEDMQIVITSTPPPLLVETLTPVAAPIDPAPPTPAEPPTVESAAPAETSPAAASGAAESNDDQGSSGEIAASSGEIAAGSGEIAPTTEEMPTARPISGPSTRRKTKRRRYQRA